jgi:disease resistance protein RPM1
MAVGLMVSVSTGAMNSLLGKLTTLMGEEFARLKNLRKQVKFIQDELIGMKDALEELLFLNELDTQTKRWRDIVRDMSYDIEDIIDDFMQNIGENNKSTGFVSNTVRRLKTSRARHRIAGQIEDIKKIVLETSLRHERYNLDIPQQRNVFIDPQVATLYENADNLVGVEGPATEYGNWLNDEEKQLKVVSIVGFGGLGKTTLANQVYHKLEGEFQCGAFVPVSQKPNMSKLLHSLLTQLGCGQPFHDYELNVLLDQVRENLKNKRYFFLLCILLLFTSSSDTWIVLKIFNIVFFYRELIFNLIKKYFLLP